MVRILEPSVTLEWITPDAVRMIERAARTCYKSECKDGGSPADFVRRVIFSYGHESVVEHAVASLRIVCDRGISHEIVRHRIASYSQESTRYVSYAKARHGGELQVIQPSTIKLEDVPLWYAAMEDAERYYRELIRRGESPQVARAVLPTCAKTEIVMTANFREWLHFLWTREHKSAHPDIRVIAGMVREVLAGQYPEIFAEQTGDKEHDMD